MRHELSADPKKRFREWIEAARGAAKDLDSLLDNLGVTVQLDCSETCLGSLEDLYWSAECGALELPAVLISLDDFIALVCRYLGQCIVDRTGLLVDELVGCDQCRVARRKKVERIRIDRDTWGGEDIFRPSGLYGAILVTERFVDFVRQNGFTNFHFIHQDDYSEPREEPQERE